MKPRPDLIDIHVGHKLKYFRKIKGFSQAQLSEKIGIAFQQLQKYEKGINRISASRMYKASIALEIGVEKFYDGLDNSDLNYNDAQDIASFDNDTIKMIAIFKKIESEKTKKSIIKLIKTMIET